MIFDTLVLRNFGPFLGPHTLHLTPPSGASPIVLIGGMNGAGKTTLLDALQLVLYGKLARCSKREGLAYDEFLRRSVHHAADPDEGCALELTFRHTEEGKERTYQLTRAWTALGRSMREGVSVVVNGMPDPVLTDTWESAVERFIPWRISPLFFFDGEKIEAFADPQRSAELLASAVHSLLGVDIVNRLHSDLNVLERRKRLECAKDEDRRQIEEAEAVVAALEERNRDLVLRRGATQNQRDRREKRVREVEALYLAQGGELFDRREQLEKARRDAEQRLRDAQEKVHEVSMGEAPLLLVPNLLSAVLAQDEREVAAEQAELLDETLTKRDATLAAALRQAGAPEEILAAVFDFSEQDRVVRSAARDVSRYLRLTPDGRASLHDLYERFDALAEAASQTLRGVRDAAATLEEAERTLEAVPHEEALAAVLSQRASAEAELQAAEADLASIDEEIRVVTVDLETWRARRKTYRQAKVEADFEVESAERIVQHAVRVRETLERFRTTVVTHHVGRIEALVLDSFQRLLRKQSLIHGLRIDPRTFTITLQRPDGGEVPADRLSAGERQLLAVALLWGLARACERSLPVVVDTPLGRLDSVHRSHVVERYLPNASHQVVLLSTDEEIQERQYPILRGSVGHKYHLWFDENSQSTEIREGYFPEGAEAYAG